MHEYLIALYTALVLAFDHLLSSQATPFADEACKTEGLAWVYTERGIAKQAISEGEVVWLKPD